MQCSCGHDSVGRCPEVDYSEQDELINESLARGEPRSELPVPDEDSRPDVGEAWAEEPMSMYGHQPHDWKGEKQIGNGGGHQHEIGSVNCGRGWHPSCVAETYQS
jgi:hypothetical protein